ncbi:uncharacterized protein LOC131667472 [Phymastichus coffea]|uniref:uncharacterized protein LOC131667472 n=1 Tax=Phymastichus coffea TaxID=108790 RepID=UPI00273B59F4|nr:uncharacterized protein LOC131667472 [Phymastichus coffea]
MLSVPTVTFNDGNKMPMLGLGTYLSKPGEVEDAVKHAIEIGYRHIDTAYFYENEKEIGKAIKEKINDGTVKRQELFITTKLWCNSHNENEVVPACKQSLINLGLDYVDLYLIHWPMAFKSGNILTPRDASKKIEFIDTDYLETWRGMEECKRQGLAKSIGVSNFNSEQLTRLLSAAKIKPVNNQVEVTLNLNNKTLREFCKKHDITVTGFSPLGRPGNRHGIKNLWDDPKIQEIAEKYKKTPANIACRFLIQLGVTPIPKSVTKSRIKENFNIFDFALTADEVKTIEDLETGARVAPFDEAKEAKFYPFTLVSNLISIIITRILLKKMIVPQLTLNNDYSMPMLGLGTAKVEPLELIEAVKYAIDIGYRLIDTAYLYGNEKYIGAAIREKINDCTVKREDLFITSKLWSYSHREHEVVPALEMSLKDLGLEYVDLYLIHWPFALIKGTDFVSLKNRGETILADDIDYLETWKGMEKCQELGLTRSIGLSNFNSEQICRLLSKAEIKPVNNQVEISLNLNQKPLIDFCKSKNISVTGYSPLGKPGNSVGLDNLWGSMAIQNLRKKYNKSAAQIALRFITQLGAAVIPKSANKSRIKENFEIFDFTLTPDEIIELRAIETGRRMMTKVHVQTVETRNCAFLWIKNMAVPFAIFNDEQKMPMFGLGTYLSQHGEVREAVKYAIEIGYRHIDTASFYNNEKEVGDAIREKIKDGTVKRKDIFVTTKLWSNAHKEDMVVPACKKSLQNLGLDYVDLYLIHWPFAFKEGDELMPKDASGKLILSDTDYLETWKGMEACKLENLTKSIGISNFNSEQITRLLAEAKIKPVNNQIELSINLNQKHLVDFCKKHDITITAYSPLGRPGNRYGIKNSWDHQVVQEIMKKYGKTAAQVACRFVLQMGAAPIPKSVTPLRIKENFDIFDFVLTEDEMHSIQSIQTGDRVAAMAEAVDSKYYPFNIPF